MQVLIPAGHDAALDQNEPVVLVPGFCRHDRAFGLTCGVVDGGGGGGGYEDGGVYVDRDCLASILRSYSVLVRSQQVCPNDPVWMFSHRALNQTDVCRGESLLTVLKPMYRSAVY